MNKLTLLAAAAALTVSGAAFAQNGPRPDPYGDATMSKADADKAGAAHFDQIDTNHDGNLSAEEIAAAPGGRGLTRADANGDGMVSKAEYMAAQSQRFAMMDANHDGQLTKAERDGFRQKMMDRMRANGGMGGPGGSMGGPAGPGGPAGQ
ncbi:MAG: EF-hand protein [Novosphingobium sp.]|nr:EF-hand protein [Novosphingobium sp.]